MKATAPSPAAAASRNEAAPKAQILLVDDRPDKLLALETMLEPLQQPLVKVRSGDEALRALLRQDFAVILLDVNMPGLDGFETAALIRKRRRSETTPIIFISAINDTENHVSRGYSLGAVDYILSPVVPEILRAKVAAFVDLHLKTEQIKLQAEEHAQLIQEQAARAQAEAARERMEFLAEAGKVLAGSLDYHQTFTSLARLIVPRLADFCLIDRMSEDGKLLQVAVAHRDPAKEERLREIRYPEADEQSHGALRVFQTGKPFLCHQVTETVLAELLPEIDRPLARELGPTSFAAVPLNARGRIIGAITMVQTDAGRTFGSEELALADELAHRTALALDNVELYRKANRAREEAEAANVAKDRFLAMLSHELRTPLTPVITHLVKLETDETVPAALRGPLDIIRRNVELEARLIDDLLDLTRVGTGKIHLEPRVVDVHALLRSALEICRDEIEAKGLQLEVALEAGQFHVSADPARLQQVLWNVIKNAVKFTSAGEIRIATGDRESGHLCITIRDTGIGMEEKVLQRAFKPFEQAQSGTKGGLGLGLAITKELVELHQGAIVLESAGLGQGTTVSIELPAVAEIPATPVDKPTRLRNPSRELRILLLEDHPDTNESLTMLLELWGYAVSPALTVSAALALAESQEFDLLISDLSLPDGSPEVVMQAVRCHGTPGIALSGFGMEKDVEMSRGFGFGHHLVKPVDVGRLQELLAAVAERSQPVA